MCTIRPYKTDWKNKIEIKFSSPKKLNKEIINLNKEEVISLKNVDALTVNIDDDYNLPHNLYSLNENISKSKQIYSSNVDVLSHTLISNNLDFSANENTLISLDNNLCFSI